eukprot:Pompholyxophrys_punicea_v1_NODE_611_length_1598_cov_10.871679.p1 type:complete len:281 gc:universal NODE_611_length_1598_cov_10.871679:73-915(+)
MVKLLKPGDVQHFVFKFSDPPPFYAPNCPLVDTINSQKPKKQLTQKGKARVEVARSKAASEVAAAVRVAKEAASKFVGDQASAFSSAAAMVEAVANSVQNADPVPSEVDNKIEGYANKPKGKKQILWERGLWKDGMTSGNKNPDLDMDLVLANCRDFKEEKTALQALVEDRGHVLIMSPKCSPELAGLGIEYSWGKSKQEFRRHINDGVAAHLHNNIEKALSVDVLPLWRVRKFARRTREYRHVYADSSNSSYTLIEKMVKERKCHRIIVDIEAKFLNAN